ncbi:MAG: M67 family metallopeptidase [Chloroflexota bacterium]|nr:M67 family metallopeptidase [Chloroflexota bacterium]
MSRQRDDTADHDVEGRVDEEFLLPLSLRDEIVAHAREQAPHECCGLLAGHGSAAGRVVRCRNVHETPVNRYKIDPREQLECFRDMERRDEELVGIYHSHPVSQPYPSPTDRAEAHYPEACYVLVSLRAGEPELHAYRINEGFVREVALTE